VVDLQRHASHYRSKSEAVDYAKRVAFAHQPSQVVLFTATGNMETVAHYQLPEYHGAPSTAPGDQAPLFDAAVKALVISGLVTAGVAVLGDLINSVQRDLKKESGRTRAGRGSKRQLQEV
jgi:hypothetical protein